jgi:LacI family transcriptional regulator
MTLVEGDGAADRTTRPVTLADIARAAGTSASTASRAINGKGYVSESARARLLDAADRLGYVPDASARTLKQKTSRVIGVVVSDLGNQFYGRLSAAIEQTLREADYQMALVSDDGENAEELAAVRTFLAMRAPGVIMTPVAADACELLSRHGVSVVEVDRRLAGGECDAVVIDNERGARDATAHLLRAGHRRVALLVAETNWTSDVGRLAGYRQAHDEAGLPVDERLIVRVAFQAAADAEQLIGDLLERERPTALFAANNLLAEQAWRLIRARGLRLPDNISLVGFDDVPWMEMVSPGITVVAQPTEELGRRAAQLLLRRIADPGCTHAVERLRPTLVVRGSTGPPIHAETAAGGVLRPRCERA